MYKVHLPIILERGSGSIIEKVRKERINRPFNGTSTNSEEPDQKPQNVMSYKVLNDILTECTLSYDVASGSEITPCNKIDKPLVVYRFTGNVFTSITTLRT